MARGVYVSVDGYEKVRDYLAKLREGTEHAGNEIVIVGSALRYAYGIETGRTRRGRLARRAGGAFYLRNALKEVQPQLKRQIAEALPKGEEGVLRVLIKAGHDVQREAQQRVPVVTGTLRRSIHTVIKRR